MHERSVASTVFVIAIAHPLHADMNQIPSLAVLSCRPSPWRMPNDPSRRPIRPRNRAKTSVGAMPPHQVSPARRSALSSLSFAISARSLTVRYPRKNAPVLPRGPARSFSPIVRSDGIISRHRRFARLSLSTRPSLTPPSTARPCLALLHRPVPPDRFISP